MKKILLFSLLATLASCAPKADNEMKEICHDVINKNRGVIHHAVKPYPSGQGYKALKYLLGLPLNPNIAKMYPVHGLEVNTH